MSTHIDYTQIAAKLDYAAVEKKLEQLGFVLISEDEQSYKEPDGSITTDVFLIFEYAKQSI